MKLISNSNKGNVNPQFIICNHKPILLVVAIAITIEKILGIGRFVAFEKRN